MELNYLLQGLDIVSVAGVANGDVSDVCYDSRKCQDRSLFVAISGLKYDGHQYIDHAIKQGAAYIIYEHDITFQPNVVYVKVKNSRRTLGRLGRNFFGNPTAELCLIGITGTNGKTTVSYLLESILKTAGISVGVVGTINSRYGDEIHESSITTPESIDLQQMFRQMVDAGVTHVVMEVSSHALDQGRVDDCEYDYGIFTNLSQDHLDYHHTIEKYYIAKRRYFREILKDGRKMIINGDDPWGRQMIRETEVSATTFGIHRECTVSSGHFDLSLTGIQADVTTSNGNFSVSSALIGKFNLYNILASVAVAVKLGIEPDVIKQGIEQLRNVPGRFQKVSRDEEPAVFVDYAHTDDALRNVLENLVLFKTHNIITVFGCGGDRDRGKRPLMGKAASDLSDLAIITSDNPRTEDPLEIINQIESGVRESSARKVSIQGIGRGEYDKGYTIIPDRREAIFTAVSIAGPRDIILVAGKGHENYQILGEKRIFFDDSIVAREALDKRRTEIVE